MMSNEEWDRKVEFILSQQAQFEAHMIELKAAQAASEKRLDRTSEMLLSYATITLEEAKITAASIRELRESQKVTDNYVQGLSMKMQELRESQTLTDEQIQRLTIKLMELSESQKLTDEQLRKFSMKVDRLTGESGLPN